MSNYLVTDNRDASRYEMRVEDQLCVIDYQRRTEGEHSIVDMLHAEVPLALRGRSLGEQLLRGALELAQQHHERIIPSCSFVALFIRRHREYQSLLA